VGSRARSVGVEEELLLVDPSTRASVALSDRAEAANESGTEVGTELFRHQVETSTPPLRSAEDLGKALRDGRRAVGEAAAAAGARAVAVATSPLAPVQAEQFTNDPRYLRIQGEYGEVAREAHVCAMHVHVEVGDDDEAVRVVDGIRPWLPVLTAISANSPYWRGRDTGFASWRSQVWGRWSSAGPKEPFGDLRTYREVADRTVAWGGALDPAMLYFEARPSASYPTVEVRVADVCLEVEDAVLVALLARALVATFADLPADPWRADLLAVAAWRASRHGLAGDLVHPVRRELSSPREVFAALVDRVGDQLDETGDRDLVVDHFEQVLARGNGAVRQRRVLEESGDLVRVVDDLADATEASWS
jgi:carboxylate-amine ligase